MKRSSPGVCRDSDIERYKASRFERAEAMREIVRIIARIMRKKRARRSRNSTTVSKKQGRIGTRYTSVRVTTMHSNDSNLSGNYFDSTCICIVERTRSISLSLSPGLFKRGQRRRGNDSPSPRFSRLVSSFQRRERGFDAIFHDSTWNLIPWILAFLDRDSPRATANLRVWPPTSSFPLSAS